MANDTTVTATPFDVQSIRDQFPVLKEEMNGKPLIFLDSAASSQKPLSVINRMSEYYEKNHANVHRGVYQLSQKATDLFEEGREKVRSFINAASTQEVIFTRGTTESINLLANSFAKKYINKGDEVIISSMEHHSNIVPWQMVCEERGATLKIIPINEKGEIKMDEFEALITPQTKMIAVVHVSNALGTINPVKEIIDIAHNHNVPVMLDGAQATLHTPIDVQDLDVDFYVFSGHKVYGPTGIGILYGKKEYLDEMPPYHGGGEMIETVTFEKTTYNELPFKFEAGTPDIAGVVGLSKAIDFVQSIGYDVIHNHEQQLLEYAMNELSQIDGIQFIGTADQKASVISFNIEGAHPYDVGTILDKLGIAVRTGHHCTQPLMNLFGIPGTVRASFAIYNTKEDVDALVEGVRRAAKMLR